MAWLIPLDCNDPDIAPHNCCECPDYDTCGGAEWDGKGDMNDYTWQQESADDDKRAGL